jgi:hypothetical protein
MESRGRGKYLSEDSFARGLAMKMFAIGKKLKTVLSDG